MTPAEHRAVFVGALGAPLVEHFAAMSDLDARIASWLDRATQAYPDFAPEPAALLPYLAARITSDSELVRVEELALACACAAGDHRAIAVFEAKYLRDLDACVARIHAPVAVVEDAKQQLRERLLVSDAAGPPRIAHYAGRSRLETWLHVAMTREVLRLLERARPYVALDERRLTELPFLANNPELRVIQAEIKEQFEVAFQAALASLTPRDRNLLRQHYLDGLSIDQLGTRHQMHRATAARWLKKATESLLARTRELLMEHLALSPSQCDSFLRGLESHLDVSIRRYLA